MKFKFLISLCIALIAMQITASYSPSRIKNLEKYITTSTITAKYGSYTASVIRAYDLLSTNTIGYQQYVYIQKHSNFKSKIVHFDDGQIGQSIDVGDGRTLTINSKNQVHIIEQ
ncbi:MAG: hypothetical protein Q8Q60_03575 [Candidatus Chromulinivorax sp.]|nr:hypothetical protein [Candidatus Chromulinivorax sp.]